MDEGCWNLEKHKFYTEDNEINDSVPRFQFLQDKNSVYFGAEYTLLDDINLAGLNKRDIYFQITIVSADTDKKTYSYNAEPIDENGNLSGIVTKHCTKAADLSENFKFSSKVHDRIWVFEFSQPISELIFKDNQIIKYNVKFKNNFLKEKERSYYPRRHELNNVEIK